MIPLALAALLALPACRSIQTGTIGLANRSTARITEARVSFGTFGMPGYEIAPGGIRGYGIVYEPVPDSATVEWTTADGVARRRRVAVARVLPPKHRDGVMFTIGDGDSVAVSSLLGRRPRPGRPAKP